MQKNPDAGGVAPRVLFALIPAALVVVADERIKWWALQHAPDESGLSDPGILEIAVHQNWGIAFNIPFKMPLIIAISIAIGIALLYVAARNVTHRPMVSLSAALVVVGAMGNLYDRLAYGFTVDYIIILGRSAINLSDVIIVTGAIMLLYASRVRKQRRPGRERNGPEGIDTVSKMS